MRTYSTLAFLRLALAPAVRPLLACLALAAAAVPARAAEAAWQGQLAARGADTAAPVLAQWNWWFWLGYFSNVGSRGNVITLCVVIFCVSLVILMSATRRT